MFRVEFSRLEVEDVESIKRPWKTMGGGGGSVYRAAVFFRVEFSRFEMEFSRFEMEAGEAIKRSRTEGRRGLHVYR